MSTEKPSPKTKKPEKQDKTPEKGDLKEIGGFENRPEPTRYGDWDVGGRCSDF